MVESVGFKIISVCHLYISFLMVTHKFVSWVVAAVLNEINLFFLVADEICCLVRRSFLFVAGSSKLVDFPEEYK